MVIHSIDTEPIFTSAAPFPSTSQQPQPSDIVTSGPSTTDDNRGPTTELIASIITAAILLVGIVVSIILFFVMRKTSANSYTLLGMTD